MLILDNKYTVDLLCNKMLVTKVWTTDESMTVRGNDRTIKATRKSYVKRYGEVWFDERYTTNILLLKNIKGKFRFTYDSNNGGVFTVQKTRAQEVNFNIHKYRLCYHNTKNLHAKLVQTKINNE